MTFMTHPDLPEADPAITTDVAFTKVWEKKGWKIVQPTTETAPTVAPTMAPKPKPEV
jgi:hypothetical protein